MPRPKRSKVALTTTRVAKPAPPKQQTKATTQPRKLSRAMESFSEDSEGLVVKSKPMRPRRKMPGQKSPEPPNDANLTMTGALPAEDEESLQPTKKRTPKSTVSQKTRTMRSTRSSTGKTSPAVVTSGPADSVAVEILGESADLESSGFGDLTFSSLGSESPAHGTRPPSAIKVGATPAHEASILALTNFKRRARQPSLLRMVQQNTDVEDNDHSGLDDTDNFDFDDFLPQAESTPLNVRKNVASDDLRNDSGTQVSSSGSRGVKRKLSPVVQVPRSSPPFDPPSGADVESTRSSSPSLPEVLSTHEQVVEQTQEEAEPLSETYAPPMSSSPVREELEPPRSPVQKPVGRRGRSSRKTPKYDESDSEETETPARYKRTMRTKAQQSISTAQLKGLLPRRRNYMLKDRDEFDIDSSEITAIDSDQDELQMPNPRTRQRQGPGKLASPKAAKKTTRGRKAAPVKPSRTYSRRISSDKENDAANEEVDEPTEASIIEHSEKLAAIKKKFEEVDKFELEFETVDVTTSSSPFR